MKRFLSLLLIMAMLMSMAVAASAAENEATAPGVVITADKTEVVPGDTITYTVTLTNAASIDGGVWNYEYFVSVPAGLTLVDGAAVETEFSKAAFHKDTRMGTAMGRVGSGYTGGDLVLANFTCTVNEGVEGQLTVATTNIILADQYGNEVIGATGSATVSCTNGFGTVMESAGIVLTVDKTEVIPGDTVTYTVILTNAANLEGGVWSYEYYLDIPAGLTLVEGSVVDTTVFSAGFFLKDMKKGTSLGRFGTGYMGADLVLATFTCTVDEDAEGALTVSTYKVTLSGKDGVSVKGMTGSITVNTAVGHICTPKAVAEVPATCTSDGVKAHSECDCGKLYMGGVEVTEADLIIPAIGHANEDENEDYCDVCDKQIGGIINGYYYEDGKKCGIGGLIFWNGNYYYITNAGKVYKSGTRALTVQQLREYADILAEGKYTFDADGKMIVKDGIVWEEKGGKIVGCYYQRGQMCGVGGLVFWNENYYYITSSGTVFTDGARVLSAKQLGEFTQFQVGASYRFYADGTMRVRSGVVDGFYYVNDKKTGVGGLVKEADGHYYYITSTGKVYKGGTRTLTTEQLLEHAEYFDAGYYTFDADGKMIVKDGIVWEENEGKREGYYYVRGQKCGVGGLVYWEGNYYYITNSGKVFVGTRKLSGKQLEGFEGTVPEGRYTFGDDGKMIMP